MRLKTKDSNNNTNEPIKTQPIKNMATPARILSGISRQESSENILDGPKYHIAEINAHASINRPCLERKKGRTNSSIIKQNTVAPTTRVKKASSMLLIIKLLSYGV